MRQIESQKKHQFLMHFLQFKAKKTLKHLELIHFN
jgi:hypothetical protein